MISKEQQSKNAIEWIENLLYGKFKQGKGKLGNEEEGFCCWGLLCYTLKKEYDPLDEWDDSNYIDIGFNNEDGCITPCLYGFDDLSSVNDVTKAGFKRIAKYLIKHSDTNFNPYVSDKIKKHFNKKS
jgi:hypothetical protein